jgi:hypothetical protein
MTDKQITAIKCAYLDLVGALEARNNMDIESHDWKAHLLSIQELEEEFKFIEPKEINQL